MYHIHIIASDIAMFYSIKLLHETTVRRAEGGGHATREEELRKQVWVQWQGQGKGWWQGWVFIFRGGQADEGKVTIMTSRWARGWVRCRGEYCAGEHCGKGKGMGKDCARHLHPWVHVHIMLRVKYSWYCIQCLPWLCHVAGTTNSIQSQH